MLGQVLDESDAHLPPIPVPVEPNQDACKPVIVVFPRVLSQQVESYIFLRVPYRPLRKNASSTNSARQCLHASERVCESVLSHANRSEARPDFYDSALTNCSRPYYGCQVVLEYVFFLQNCLHARTHTRTHTRTRARAHTHTHTQVHMRCVKNYVILNGQAPCSQDFFASCESTGVLKPSAVCVRASCPP